MSAAAALVVRRVEASASCWPELIEILRTAFAYMDGRVDPPSSIHRLTVEQMRRDAGDGAVLVAEADGEILGCVTCKPLAHALYLGKLAVREEARGRGVARALVDAAASEARRRGLAALELQTRVELVENHAAFVRLGFVKVGESAHAGYARPTSITMRRSLAAA